MKSDDESLFSIIKHVYDRFLLFSDMYIFFRVDLTDPKRECEQKNWEIYS